ncbi:hypothetical protein ACS7SF_12315 [Ralstonia sp. 25C]|uniref:hypothetical protein n=1 Tax=Ralstonia sp. 25C TaxID=3447363 RepID=UPI003F74F45E
MAKTGEKGYLLEELLRAYFLRAGMYAVRGVPLQLDGDDLTDVDIWLYERPTGSSRRRQIVDAKSKLKPKAIERLLWTRGLFELLQVDGAYVATTDNRSMLKEISSRLGVAVLDGADLKRMAESEKVLFADRLSEEDLDKAIKAVNRGRRNKDLQLRYQDLKAGLIDGFGSGTVNRALDHFVGFARVLGACHPSSGAAEAALRLAYIAASIVAITLDFALTKVSFKSTEERRNTILNVIRYGDEDEVSGMEKVRVAAALIERYAPNGRAISQSMLNAIQEDFQSIPAEVVADHVLSQLKGDALFRVARSLEFEGFKVELQGFDQLPLEEKSFLGVLMDFAGLERSAFADAWSGNVATKSVAGKPKVPALGDKSSPGPLFES